MKDKELRKLLKSKGLIHSEISDHPLAWNWTTDNDVGALKERVKGLEHSNRDRIEAAHMCFEELYKAKAKIKDLGASVHINHELACSASEEGWSTQKDVKVLTRNLAELHAKFDAINKHYGISVEKQEAQYVVKEGE